MRHAAVLHPQMRRVFVEHLAYELRGRTIGDGVVFRACAKVLKEDRCAAAFYSKLCRLWVKSGLVSCRLQCPVCSKADIGRLSHGIYGTCGIGSLRLDARE